MLLLIATNNCRRAWLADQYLFPRGFALLILALLSSCSVFSWIQSFTESWDMIILNVQDLLYRAQLISSTVYIIDYRLQSVLDCISDDLGQVRLLLQVSVKKKDVWLSLLAFQKDKMPWWIWMQCKNEGIVVYCFCHSCKNSWFPIQYLISSSF